MQKHTQLPEQQNPTERFSWFLSFLFLFLFFLICRMISSGMEKGTQKWPTTLFVCPHTDPKRDTSHSSPPSRPNIKGVANEPVDMMTSSAISSILL